MAYKTKGKKATLLSLLPQGLFRLAKDLLEPLEMKSNQVTYEKIVDVITRHEQPETTVLVARFNFDRLSCLVEEGVGAFVRRVRHAASQCKFSGAVKDERLRDRFVAGLNKPKIVGQLLMMGPVVTFGAAVEKALALETTLRDAEILMKESTNEMAAGESCRKKERQPRDRKDFKCFECGQAGHYAQKCRQGNDERDGRRWDLKWTGIVRRC